MQNVTVLGAGSWGTALALHAARRGRPTTLWTRRADHHAAMTEQRRNTRYLTDFDFPQQLTTTDDLGQALDGAHMVICGVPSHGMRAMMGQVAAFYAAHPEAAPPMYLIAAKGIEVDSLANMHQVLTQELPVAHRERIAALGGPSFAAEVAKGLPTTVVVGSEHEGVQLSIQQLLSGDGVRAYVTDDILGVELGGAFKNVIAMAAGIGDGAGLGDNARAGIITRGLAEISRLAIALGALPATLAGLAGLGDLVLTCCGGLSRNRRVGIALGQGKKLDQILEEMGMVAEGVKNTKSARRLAQQQGVEMPLVAMMYAILYEEMAVPDAVNALMGRALRAERG
ncbi:MAG: NAD(P)-dependent glycerol-3-phosphate dehydrogenase [Deltaproteobacteria bacterium]|nr:NAD(P)-dependent glycerol-3-phosphate dehydrogenase [Deltaproteobacteria bacterium]